MLLGMDWDEKRALEYVWPIRNTHLKLKSFALSREMDNCCAFTLIPFSHWMKKTTKTQMHRDFSSLRNGTNSIESNQITLQ